MMSEEVKDDGNNYFVIGQFFFTNMNHFNELFKNDKPALEEKKEELNNALQECFEVLANHV